jgi:hypothetical protein
VPPWAAANLAEIARREGLTISALICRIVVRYVESYPLDEVD